MPNQTHVNRVNAVNPVETGFDDYVALDGVAPMHGGSAGLFGASLHYAAADLSELARTAPLDKREPLMAVVRLLRSIADG